MEDEAVTSAHVADIEARLKELEAERAVLSTLYRYGHAIDYGLEGEWVDCFTEEGEYDLRYRTGLLHRPADGGVATENGVIYRGRDQIAAFVAGHSRAPDKWHKHLLVEPAISLSPRSATCTSYFVRVDERDGQSVIVAFGRYLDRLVPCADGRWRFEQRIAEIETLQR
jgi:hypothetical protein